MPLYHLSLILTIVIQNGWDIRQFSIKIYFHWQMDITSLMIAIYICLSSQSTKQQLICRERGIKYRAFLNKFTSKQYFKNYCQAMMRPNIIGKRLELFRIYFLLSWNFRSFLFEFFQQSKNSSVPGGHILYGVAYATKKFLRSNTKKAKWGPQTNPRNAALNAF